MSSLRPSMMRRRNAPPAYRLVFTNAATGAPWRSPPMTPAKAHQLTAEAPTLRPGWFVHAEVLADAFAY